MSEYIEREKIKTCFAQIIVNNSEDKPYYSIMYWENGEMNIGFSSYKLDYVRRWLNEEFEVNRNADVALVVHGRWAFETETLNALSRTKCNICGWWTLDPSVDGAYNFCPNCGAKMDGGTDND